MIDPQLIEILACPEDHSRLTPAEPALIERINTAISAGKVSNRGGAVVEESIAGGLIREDGKWLYLIRDEIPVMLIDEAIALPLPGSE